jgi:hypothetical protein
MRTPADRARENSIALEVKKDGLQQRQNGDWVLRFSAQNIDMHQVIVNAPMGTRFQCVLVEINDDEEPVDHKAEARDKWRDLGPTKQAGIRCGDPVFWAWMEEKLKKPDINSHEAAAKIVREMCGVTSRSEFDKPGNQEARTRWYNLDFAFQAWRAKENA